LKEYAPQDATTNPSDSQSVANAGLQNLVEKAIAESRQSGATDRRCCARSWINCSSYSAWKF